MKNPFFAIAVILIILSSCKSKKDKSTTDPVLVSAVLSDPALKNDSSVQYITLTVTLRYAKAATVNFMIRSSRGEFYTTLSKDSSEGQITGDFPTSYFTRTLEEGQDTMSVPLIFKGNAISDTGYLETITVSTDSYAPQLSAVAIAMIGLGPNGSPYNDLFIPDLDTGKIVGHYNNIPIRHYNLSLDTSSVQFLKGPKTTTFSYNEDSINTYLPSDNTINNRLSFWGPTLLMNDKDSVLINIHNKLDSITTTHWHGFHIPAKMDGGPHQPIDPNTIWSPTFIVRDPASLYWYHPHLHKTTYEQLSMGAGGMIIIRDNIESKLKLPRTYGVDDIPMVLTSRRFLSNNQFAKDETQDEFGDYLLTNGIISAQKILPKQFVRLRILNAEIERGFTIGFRDNRDFYVIGNDGGILKHPVKMKRLILVPAERVEIMVDFSKDEIDSGVDLMAFNSGNAFGYPGGGFTPVLPTGQSGPAFNSFLQNTDFNLLHIVVGKPTENAITSIPEDLNVNDHYWTLDDVTDSITTNIVGGAGNTPFSFDSILYNNKNNGDPNSANDGAIVYNNDTIALNSIVKWTFINNMGFGHSIHIHDIAFKIISRSSGPVADYESGWKDVFYIRIGETVQVIAKFDDFADDEWPYMFHCHLLTHEDAGLMGEFLVMDKKKPDGKK